MSQVISFRLDEDEDANPDEARALGILQSWRDKGWETREVFTRLLLTLEGIEPVGKNDKLVQDFEEVLDQLRGQALMAGAIVDDLQTVVNDTKALGNVLGMIPQMLQTLNEIRQIASAPRSPELPAPNETSTEPELKADFMASVKRGARPGMRRQGS